MTEKLEQPNLGSPYTFKRYLTKGGMGYIFLAHHDGLDIDVAVKRQKDEQQERVAIESEARVLTELKHQYLPRIYDIIRTNDGRVYLTMDYIVGRNVKEIVEQDGPIDQRKAVKWAKQLCEVVGYLHQLTPPIIHCDIKPGNVMITEKDDICLIDFGLSQVVTGKQKSIGKTPGFTAPETDISPATDIYSIGALLYYALTGKVPEDSSEKLTPVKRYNEDLNGSWIRIIHKAMEKNASKRYASAREMYTALDLIWKTEARYRRHRVICGILTLTMLTCYAISSFCIYWGWNLMRKEKDSIYHTYIAQGVDALQKEEYEQSEVLLDKAIALFPEKTEGYLFKANLLYNQQKYQECLNHISKVFQENDSMDPETQASFLHLQARCYLDLNQNDLALERMELAMEYSQSDDISLDYAIALARSGQFEEAEHAISGIDEHSATFAKGEINFSMKKYLEAEQYLLRAARENEDIQLKSKAYFMAAQAADQANSPDAETGLQILEEAVQIIPAPYYWLFVEQLAQHYYNEGSATGNQSAYQNSLDYFLLLQRNGQQDLNTLMSIVIVQQTLDLFDDALATLKQAQSLYPSEYSVPKRAAYLEIDYQGTLPQEARDYRKANEAYQLAVSLYEKAKIRGVDDVEMARLDHLMEQLKAGGWL